MMLNRSSVSGSLVCFAVLAASVSPALADKVRIVNNTDTDIRVKCLAFDQGVGFLLDVAQNQNATQSNVATGSRGFVVWEDFNEKVVLTGSFDKEAGKNVKLTITGDVTNGYTVQQTYHALNDTTY